MGYDIALLFLKEKSSKDHIQFLDMHSNCTTDGLLMDTLGYGMRDPLEPRQEELMLARDLVYRNQTECSLDYEELPGFITKTMLCAQAMGRGICTRKELESTTLLNPINRTHICWRLTNASDRLAPEDARSCSRRYKYLVQVETTMQSCEIRG